jgi:iron complex outermembrane receptor protein
LKVGADYCFNDKSSLGFDVLYNSNQVLRGDSSNQADKFSPYAVINLCGRHRFYSHMEFFARVNNVYDKDYENFDLLSEALSQVDIRLFTEFENQRFVGPGVRGLSS